MSAKMAANGIRNYARTISDVHWNQGRGNTQDGFRPPKQHCVDLSMLAYKKCNSV